MPITATTSLRNLVNNHPSFQGATNAPLKTTDDAKKTSSELFSEVFDEMFNEIFQDDSSEDIKFVLKPLAFNFVFALASVAFIVAYFADAISSAGKAASKAGNGKVANSPTYEAVRKATASSPADGVAPGIEDSTAARASEAIVFEAPGITPSAGSSDSKAKIMALISTKKNELEALSQKRDARIKLSETQKSFFKYKKSLSPEKNAQFIALIEEFGESKNIENAPHFGVKGKTKRAFRNPKGREEYRKYRLLAKEFKESRKVLSEQDRLDNPERRIIFDEQIKSLEAEIKKLESQLDTSITDEPSGYAALISGLLKEGSTAARVLESPEASEAIVFEAPGITPSAGNSDSKAKIMALISTKKNELEALSQKRDVLLHFSIEFNRPFYKSRDSISDEKKESFDKLIYSPNWYASSKSLKGPEEREEYQKFQRLYKDYRKGLKISIEIDKDLVEQRKKLEAEIEGLKSQLGTPITDESPLYAEFSSHSQSPKISSVLLRAEIEELWNQKDKSITDKFPVYEKYEKYLRLEKDSLGRPYSEYKTNEQDNPKEKINFAKQRENLAVEIKELRSQPDMPITDEISAYAGFFPEFIITE